MFRVLQQGEGGREKGSDREQGGMDGGREGEGRVGGREGDVVPVVV
jgi:hypothetical protein